MKKKFLLKPGVLWITGLSGAGKTTISKLIYTHLRKKYYNIILLDGDKLRRMLNLKKQGTFSYNSRKKIGLRYSKICQRYVNKKYFVIISVMALIKSVHKWNKKNLKNYLDVYLKVPMKVLVRRDPKKIYRDYKLKKISNVDGLDLEFDEPINPTILIRWKKNLTSKKISDKIIKKIFLKK